MSGEETDAKAAIVAGCIGAGLMGALIMFAWNPVLWFYESNVVVILWRWFLVPMGVPAITWAQAAGINFILAVFLYRPRPHSDDEKMWPILVQQVLAPSVCLFWGWVLHRFFL